MICIGCCKFWGNSCNWVFCILIFIVKFRGREKGLFFFGNLMVVYCFVGFCFRFIWGLMMVVLIFIGCFIRKGRGLIFILMVLMAIVVVLLMVWGREEVLRCIFSK